MSHDFPTLLSLGVVFKSGDSFHPLVTDFDLVKEKTIEGKGYIFNIPAVGGEEKVAVQCYALTPEGQVLSRLCDSELTEIEAQIVWLFLKENRRTYRFDSILDLQRFIHYDEDKVLGVLEKEKRSNFYISFDKKELSDMVDEWRNR